MSFLSRCKPLFGFKRSRPRILFFLDYRGWAFDNSAQEIARQLQGEFDFEFAYKHDDPQPKLKPHPYDLIYVFFWGESYHRQFGFTPERTIKEVSSHRYLDDPRLGPCTDEEMVKRYLSDADTVICTSARLQKTVAPYHHRVFHTPNGINTEKFYHRRERSGSITFGWAGNIDDDVKGVKDILMPGCEGRFELRKANGGLNHGEMNDFYNQLDVFAVASRHEGEPLTLVESMAAGCFPVCVDVGIVPELIENYENGIVLSERTPVAFREAFTWCEENPDHVRSAGKQNALKMKEQRNWQHCSKAFRDVFKDTLDYVAEGKRTLG